MPMDTEDDSPRIGYERNEKHKAPWHHGRSGTLCPRWSWEVAQDILDNSHLIDKARFAVRDGMAFKGHEHAPGKWHGHPVGWNEVPQKLVNCWLKERRVTRREVRRLWSIEDVEEYLRGRPE